MIHKRYSQAVGARLGHCNCIQVQTLEQAPASRAPWTAQSEGVVGVLDNAADSLIDNSGGVPVKDSRDTVNDGFVHIGSEWADTHLRAVRSILYQLEDAGDVRRYSSDSCMAQHRRGIDNYCSLSPHSGILGIGHVLLLVVQRHHRQRRRDLET